MQKLIFLLLLFLPIFLLNAKLSYAQYEPEGLLCLAKKAPFYFKLFDKVEKIKEEIKKEGINRTIEKLVNINKRVNLLLNKSIAIRDCLIIRESQFFVNKTLINIQEFNLNLQNLREINKKLASCIKEICENSIFISILSDLNSLLLKIKLSIRDARTELIKVKIEILLNKVEDRIEKLFNRLERLREKIPQECIGYLDKATEKSENILISIKGIREDLKAAEDRSDLKAVLKDLKNLKKDVKSLRISIKSMTDCYKSRIREVLPIPRKIEIIRPIPFNFTMLPYLYCEELKIYNESLPICDERWENGLPKLFKIDGERLELEFKGSSEFDNSSLIFTSGIIVNLKKPLKTLNIFGARDPSLRICYEIRVDEDEDNIFEKFVKRVCEDSIIFLDRKIERIPLISSIKDLDLNKKILIYSKESSFEIDFVGSSKIEVKNVTLTKNMSIEINSFVLRADMASKDWVRMIIEDKEGNLIKAFIADLNELEFVKEANIAIFVKKIDAEEDGSIRSIGAELYLAIELPKRLPIFKLPTRNVTTTNITNFTQIFR